MTSLSRSHLPEMENAAPSPNHHFINDVLIVGAGPCGLAVAARMREATPSALFTDVEHQRYHVSHFVIL
jgi:ribulose 1,5-bisphosphate synthetase/thiazole synthase